MNRHNKRFGVIGVGALLSGILVISICSCSASQPGSGKTGAASVLRQRSLLDADWAFHRGEVEASNKVISTSFDDSQWQRVQVPHDYVLDGTYDQTNARNHGYLPFEVGWYRKRFSVPESTRGQILRLDFDGVFRDSEVWLNGQHLGRHLSGYTPFSYDITELAKPGAENIIVARVDPREFEGWWYEGAGIYRHVYLTALAPLHVAQWGTYVTSKVNGGKGAELTIQTTLENKSSGPVNCSVVSEIVEPDGSLVATVKARETVAANSQHEVTQYTEVLHPKLWSLQTPKVYKLRTTVLKDEQPVDFTTTSFGIRTIQFDPKLGFFLNGQRVQIRGAASHQDFPAVGIAVPDSLQSWRVEQMKKMGCNGWRTAHNPPSEALLDACDELGMLVMDENRHLGDSYTSHSPRGTTATNMSDLTTMIRRDRNHPSIVMWSMCNEEGLQGTQEGADIFSAMMDAVHRYDKTRPITCAMNGGLLTNGIADVEDIVGVNYNTDKYDAVHQRRPNKAMFGSECMNEKTTRGQYVDDKATGMCSCYNLSDKTWLAVVNRPFMAGSYMWTGFDYRGEPNPYGWPDISNNTGLLDVCGFRKDKGYYFESCWSDKPMVHLVPSSWNWPGKEGDKIRVLAFSNARQVEVFLNGQSLGTKDVPHDSHVEWEVPYQSGKLLARGYTYGKTVATDVLETTGAPAQIQLSLERTVLKSDREDTIAVPVSILDDKGRVVPNSTNRVSFQLTGGGRILGVGNGNPADHETDRATERNVFQGHCLVIIQAGSKPCQLRLTASSPGVAPARATLKVR